MAVKQGVLWYYGYYLAKRIAYMHVPAPKKAKQTPGFGVTSAKQVKKATA